MSGLLVGDDDAKEFQVPGIAIQLQDQLDSAELYLEQQNVRPRPDKLSIPGTSLYRLESPSSCANSVSPNFALMHDPEPVRSRARNVVVFGESGVGKSSVINMIAGKHITRTSNDAVGCTFRYQSYQVLLDGLSVNLWDTVGLDEGTEGTVPAARAESSLKAFLRQITRENGIDLLLYCVRGTRVRQALLRNYNIFYAAICRKKVPVALVVTGLENYEGEMEDWWIEHEKDLLKHGMRFDAHACVTTIHSDHYVIQDRLRQSRDALQNLVRARFEAVTWRVNEDSLISVSLPDVRGLLLASNKREVPFIMICDGRDQASRIRPFPMMIESGANGIDDRRYKCLRVDAQQVLSGESKLSAETTQQPDLLIFYADADAEPGWTWTALHHFHESLGGETCPIIIVFGGLDNPEAAVRTWRLLSSSCSGEIIAVPTYYPGPGSPREMVERAHNALTVLIEEKCLIKFEEEKVTKFQKFCRHSKLLFAGRT